MFKNVGALFGGYRQRGGRAKRRGNMEGFRRKKGTAQ